MKEDEENVDSTMFKSLVGSLRYLTFTRLDILFAVGIVSLLLQNLTQLYDDRGEDTLLP